MVAWPASTAAGVGRGVVDGVVGAGEDDRDEGLGPEEGAACRRCRLIGGGETDRWRCRR